MNLLLDELEINKEVVTALIAQGKVQVEISQKTNLKLEEEYKFLISHLNNDERIYGVNTGFGKNVSKILDKNEMKDLQSNLCAYLDCSVGELQPFIYSRMSFLARLKHLVSGGVAVRPEVVSYLISLFNLGIAPAVRSNGSLGASGDLITMAPLARLCVDREASCWLNNEIVFLKDICNETLPGLEGRDALALMNGLSNAASIAVVEVEKMRSLLNLSLASIGLCKFVLSNDFKSESPVLHNTPVRRFKGQSEIASFLFEQGKLSKKKKNSQLDVQDEYTLRCIPQILGPVYESFKQVEGWVYQEINSQSDNPLITENDFYSGGNFYGGYLAFAADHLALALAKVSELLDRQTFHLVGGQKGLPVNLIRQAEGKYYHGLKGVHQLSNSLLMDITPYCHSFSLSTRSCESHNQDMVSNCTNAWNRISVVRKKFSYLLAAHLVLVVQAHDLIEAEHVSPVFQNICVLVRSVCPYVAHDISLSVMIESLSAKIGIKNFIHESVF